MSTPSLLKLEDGPKRLLEKLGAIIDCEGNRSPYEVNPEFLRRLGFDSEEALREAVTRLNSSAHEDKFWGSEAPVIRLDPGGCLVPMMPQFHEAWLSYKAEQNRGTTHA